MEPYTVREVDGVKVGIIGIVTKDTAGKVVPDGIKDIEFTDEADAINKYTEEWQENLIFNTRASPTKANTRKV